MVRRLCDETDARRLLNPGPVAIVTTSWRGAANAAPVAWTLPLSMTPPLIGLAIHPHRHTADMIRFSEEFAINIPGPDLLKQTAFLGSMSGLENNKIEAADLQTFRGLRVEAPLIEGCLAWIECGLHDVIPVGDHTLFVGSVLKVQAIDEAYAGRWLLAERRYSPLTYIGGPNYAVISEPLEAAVTTSAEGRLIAETVEEREQREETEARVDEERKAEGVEGIVEKERAERSPSRRVF